MTNYQMLEEAVKTKPGGIVKALLIFPEGKKEVHRFGLATNGLLLRIAKGHRSRGFYVREGELDNLTVTLIKEKLTLTAAERYAEDVRKWAAYILKNCHPNLWKELREQATAVTQEKLSLLVSEMKEAGGFECWGAAPKCGLPRIEGYKTLTLNSCNLPYHYKDLSIGIQEHLDKKEDFDYGWRGNYDYSVSGRLCEDGEYRAWLSQEYKGCGNGHYYLLLNGNQAIFAEND